MSHTKFWRRPLLEVPVCKGGFCFARQKLEKSCCFCFCFSSLRSISSHFALTPLRNTYEAQESRTSNELIYPYKLTVSLIIGTRKLYTEKLTSLATPSNRTLPSSSIKVHVMTSDKFLNSSSHINCRLGWLAVYLGAL